MVVFWSQWVSDKVTYWAVWGHYSGKALRHTSYLSFFLTDKIWGDIFLNQEFTMYRSKFTFWCWFWNFSTSLISSQVCSWVLFSTLRTNLYEPNLWTYFSSENCETQKPWKGCFHMQLVRRTNGLVGAVTKTWGRPQLPKSNSTEDQLSLPTQVWVTAGWQGGATCIVQRASSDPLFKMRALYFGAVLIPHYKWQPVKQGWKSVHRKILQSAKLCKTKQSVKLCGQVRSGQVRSGQAKEAWSMWQL